MFDRIRKAFSKGAPEGETSSQLPNSPMSEWAATQGFGFTVEGHGKGVSLQGRIGSRPWRMQVGPPARSYIEGEELRARAELGLDESVAVLVINRPLKEALEKQAYQMYTDSLQTSVDGTMPEEMRWLAMFDEVGWDALPPEFWKRFSVLTDDRKNAMAWVDPELARAILAFQPAGAPKNVPFLLLLLNGKAYLRMEYTPAELGTLQQASQVFIGACESALGCFPRKS